MSEIKRDMYIYGPEVGVSDKGGYGDDPHVINIIIILYLLPSSLLRISTKSRRSFDLEPKKRIYKCI